MKQLKICDFSKISTAALLFTFSHYLLADPLILPPNIVGPPPVFCFNATGASSSGDGIRLQFEILNWTDVKVNKLNVRLNTNAGISTGGKFGPTSAPISSPISGKANRNDWTVDSSNDTSVTWIAGTDLDFIDIDPNNDNNFADAPGNPGNPALPNPLDSGPNTLDGFVLNLPDLNPFERIIIDWSFNDLSDIFAELGDNGGFSFGTFQIDRAADGDNGEIRLSTAFGFGKNSDNIVSQILDPLKTDQNAIALPAAVPIPAAAWLFMSGLLGLIGIGKRRFI